MREEVEARVHQARVERQGGDAAEEGLGGWGRGGRCVCVRERGESGCVGV